MEGSKARLAGAAAAGAAPTETASRRGSLPPAGWASRIPEVNNKRLINL